MLEAIAADMLEATKDSVWRSISSRVKVYANRFGSMERTIGAISLMISVGQLGSESALGNLEAGLGALEDRSARSRFRST
jgi:hypothetical protein